jgi:FKBP-type peptidyl-prolyl cis-trans isomerase
VCLDAQVSIAEYVPKAMKLLQAKAEAAATAQAAKGLEFLAEAAKEEGATQTSSGLVIKTLTEGTGASPTAAETVQARPACRMHLSRHCV